MGEHDQHTAEHYRQDENCDDKAEVLAEGHYRVATEHETCDDGDQAEDEKNSEPDARNFLLAEVLRQTGSSWSAKISLAPIHEWRAGSHHAPVAAQGSRGAARGGERLPRPRCVVGHGGSRECFTNRRVDARKYGLSRVCLVKRMCLWRREKSPKFSIVLNRCPGPISERFSIAVWDTIGILGPRGIDIIALFPLANRPRWGSFCTSMHTFAQS